MNAEQRPPIILVHGAWHGAWCWDRVADALRSEGWRVTAVTLPGHDRPGDTSRIWHRISQYVDAVGAAVDACDQPPVLVGHSMGGYVVQRYLESADAALGVLVASAPLRGVLMANMRVMRRYPMDTLRSALTADYSFAVRTADRVRDLYFRPETSDDAVTETMRQLQNESALAVNTMMLRWPRPSRVSTPMAVVAAADDAIFSLDEQRALAEAYGVELRVIEDSGHDVMVDDNWPSLVAAIAAAAASVSPAND